MSNNAKTCRICGKMYTLDHFSPAHFSPDGHAHICKDCAKIERQKRRSPRLGGGMCRTTKALDTITKNPAFSGISSRTLIEELKSRGYKWDKMWMEEVIVERKMVVI